MADSDDDDKGQPNMAGFLFGNLDENNNLDADYLDEDVRGQLQALGGDKLGLSDALNDLNKPDTESGAGQAAAGGSQTPNGAVNFFDEQELIDFEPEQASAQKHPKAPSGAHARKKVAAKPAAVRNSKKLELPVLAKDGDNVLLRLTKIFSPAAEEMEKLHPARIRQPVTGAGEEEIHDEEEMLHQHVSELPEAESGKEEGSEAYEEEEEAEDPEEVVRQPAAGSQAAAPPIAALRRRRGRRLQAGLPLQAAFGGGLLPLAVPDTSFDAVQLLDWENGIYWGEDRSPTPSLALIVEEDEDHLSDSMPGPRQSAPAAADDAEAALEEVERMRQERITSSQQASTSNQPENVWLMEGGWEEDVRWDLDDDRPTAVVALDMNDPHLIFQLIRPTSATEDLDRAAALVLPAPPKVKVVSAPPAGKGRVFILLARQNVSLDEEYARRKAKKGALMAFRHKHAVPAMQLATLPPRHLDPQEYEHRPRGVWVPPTSKGRAKAKEGEKSTVKVVSLVGHPKLAVSRIFKGVDLTVTTINMLWDVLKAGGKFADCASLTPSQFGLWYRGALPHPLGREIPLADTDVPPDANMELSLVISGMQTVPTAKAHGFPEALRSTPVPVAIQKTKQLTAVDGHIVLLEYTEEHPLLLSRPGMVVRLATYYRRAEPSDIGHQDLLEGERWRTGAVEALLPTDDSPFLLGDIAPGKHQLALESNMYRSAGFSHSLPLTDFLVIRSASGALSLRGMTGCITAGQQEPLRRIPVPYSKECRDLEEARMVVHVMRELRHQKIRNEKKRQQQQEAPEVTITVRELVDLFPGLSDGMIRSRLKDRCSCVPFKEDAVGTYKLADGVTIADERELRQLARPEESCGLESMTAGLMRLSRLGLDKQDRLAALPFDRLQLATEQLSPPEVYSVAAAELRLAVQTTPWVLTDNFVSATREGRGALALTGPGDPTARGQGFSFMKETAKMAAERALEAGPALKDNITGTNKDLRRLTMTQSKTILLKLGLSEDDIKGLSRWQRIAAVRDLSTAAAGEDDAELGKLGTRYARVAKASSEEQMKARRIAAQQIFERQAAALGGAQDEDPGSEDESWGDELEKELEGDETASQPEAAQKSDDELEEIEALRKSGFLKEAGEGSTLQAKSKLEAKAGDRRIKRTIVFLTPAGERATRTIIYSDKDKITALNEMYKGEGKEAAAGFGRRTISGGGTWLNEEEGAAPRKTKKNMSKVNCKACGQMGHYKSNKLCPMYEQTYGKAAKAKKAKKEGAGDGEQEEVKPEDRLKITINTASLGSPMKRKQSMQEGGALKRLRSDGSSLGVQGNGRKLLGAAVLARALANVKRIVPETLWAPFRMAVTKVSAPDYTDFVPAADEMHLDKIERKIKGGKYSSGAEMLADFERIMQNAAVYNAPGNGKYGGPEIVGWAESLANAMREQLQSADLASLLAEHEEAIRLEDAEKAAQSAAAGVAGQQLPEAEETAATAVEDGAMEHWVQCSKCQKWRKISQKVADETVASAPDAPWFCEWDNERPNASCDQPDDYELEQNQEGAAA